MDTLSSLMSVVTFYLRVAVVLIYTRMLPSAVGARVP